MNSQTKEPFHVLQFDHMMFVWTCCIITCKLMTEPTVYVKHITIFIIELLLFLWGNHISSDTWLLFSILFFTKTGRFNMVHIRNHNQDQKRIRIINFMIYTFFWLVFNISKPEVCLFIWKRIYQRILSHFILITCLVQFLLFI